MFLPKEQHMKAHISFGLVWLTSLLGWFFLPVSSHAQLTAFAADQEQDRWERRVANIVLTDTSGNLREGYILYGRSDGFVWHDGYHPYQPGDSFVWIPTEAWTHMKANRKGRFGQRILNSGLLTVKWVSTGLIAGSLGQGIRWGESLILGAGFSVIYGGISGLTIGSGIGLGMMRKEEEYLSWKTDQRQIANLAAFPGRFKADTVGGILIPRASALGFYRPTPPHAALGVEWLRAGYLPWGEAGTGIINSEIGGGLGLEPLNQLSSEYRELSLFWRFRSGIHLGARMGWPMRDVRRFMQAGNANPLGGGVPVGTYVLGRGRLWGVWAEQQLLPRPGTSARSWSLSAGGGVFLQQMTATIDYIPPGFAPNILRNESRILPGIHNDIRLNYHLSRHVRTYSLLRLQWTLPWRPEPLQIIQTQPELDLRPGPVTQSGFMIGLGISTLLW